MPYADREDRLRAMRERYRERYEKEQGFALKEAARKKALYDTNGRYRERTKAKRRERYAATGQ
jgi:hypothetical protein